MNGIMPYHPGVLPSKPSPQPGDTIGFALPGLPPYKDTHFSIRNQKHKIHPRFVALREEATRAMGGRAPFRGSIQLDIMVWAPRLDTTHTLLDYTSGIMDTLDGSHGPSFTYLPIAYEDDCQVCSLRQELLADTIAHYEVRLTFETV